MSAVQRRPHRKKINSSERIICVNCNVQLKIGEGESGYRKRYPLTNRLQDRKWESSHKPGISILEGLIELMPEFTAGNISQLLSLTSLCRDCFIMLRQAVNQRFKVQNLMVELQEKTGSITDEMRIETNKQAKKAEGPTQCWLCQEKFSVKSTKIALHRHILDEMTVREAIETLLPDESITLQGVSKRYMMVCKSCLKILKQIITTQCQAEKSKQNFMKSMHENGVISRIQDYGDTLVVIKEELEDNISPDFIKGSKPLTTSDTPLEEIPPEDSDLLEQHDDLERIDEPQTQTQSTKLPLETDSQSVNLPLEMDTQSTKLPVETEAQSIRLVLETDSMKLHIETETETQSIELPLETESSVLNGVKRKLEESCTDEETDMQGINDIHVDEESTEEFVSEENAIKRRRTKKVISSILQAQLENDLFSDNIDETGDNEGRLIVDEENTVESLDENIIKKVVYHLQKGSINKAFKVLQRNSRVFEKEIHKYTVNHIVKEMSEGYGLENSDWSRLSALSSGDVTVETFVKVFENQLPLLSSILSSSISGKTKTAFSEIGKTKLLKLFMVMGLIAYESNPNCHIIQSLNSIQMAEDGCTNELYNTFHGLGLCLREKETQALLATPEYSRDKVCWDLLKEVQEKKVTASIKSGKINVRRVSSDDAEQEEADDDLSIPKDFPEVCPYWKLPKEKTPDSTESSQDVWLLYSYPEVADRAALIRLIFEEAGVPYTECDKPPDDGELGGYPTLSPPLVKKGNLKISDIPVICRYLGELFDLNPESIEDRLHAEQITQSCHDYIVEGGPSICKVDENTSTEKAKLETQSITDRFVKTRIPRYLTFFETALKTNNGGNGFLFGTKLTYADLAVLHILRLTDGQFPEDFSKMTDIPTLKAFKDRLSSRPKLKDYFELDRCNSRPLDKSVIKN